MTIIGADISFYQDDPATPQRVDFGAMARNAAFVIIRAGQRTWLDRDFKDSWRNAKDKLPRGSYWFYDSREEPKIQAALWVNAHDGDYGELPMWCDFEDSYGGAFGTWKHWYDFIEEVKRLCNHPIGIYTGYYYWTEKTTGIPKASLDYFRQYPLWIAAYNTAAPKVPAPWYDWSLWQFTDNGDGTLYGVESLNIDLNYVSDSFAKLYQLKHEEQESSMYEIRPLFSDGMNIRPQPNVNNTSIGKLLYGRVGKGVELFTVSVDSANARVGDQWLKITEGGSVEGWVAVKHMGKDYCKLDGSGTPTPEPNPEPSNDTFTVTLVDDRTGETWSGVLTK